MPPSPDQSIPRINLMGTDPVAAPRTPTRVTEAGGSGVKMEALCNSYKNILAARAIHYPRTYQLTRELGRGRQGAVMLGVHQGARGCVTERAIKLMDPSIYRNPEEYWTDMGRIATQLSRLQHLQGTNLVMRHGYEETFGIGYVEMEVIDGLDLNRLLAEGVASFVATQSQAWERDHFGRTIFRSLDGIHCLQPGLVVHILRGALRGLERLHDMGFLHFDVKPSNIMIDRLGHTRLIDFGRAVRVGERLSFLLGSPHYMSPEAHRREPCHIQSDLYSLGLVGIRMLSGHPFTGIMPRKEEDVLTFKMELPDRLHEVLPQDVVGNRHFFDIMRRMIDPDPKKRFPSVREVDTGQHSLGHVAKQLVRAGLDSEYERDIADYLAKLIDARTQRVSTPKDVAPEASELTS
jgi:serine/threonine protein kinase